MTCRPYAEAREHSMPGAANMASLHVQDLPDGVVAELERRAARNGRSVEAEVRHIIKENLQPKFSKERLLAALLAGPFNDPDFKVERSKDTGRAVDL